MKDGLVFQSDHKKCREELGTDIQTQIEPGEENSKRNQAAETAGFPLGRML
jgi:hypothetical protein